MISAEGRRLLEDDDELFVIKLIDAQGDRLGLHPLGSMLPVDTLDETVLLVALLIFVDLSERIALLYGLGDEDIFVEAKARGKDSHTELGAKPLLARDTMDGIHLVGELAGELVDLTKFVDRQRSFIVIVDVDEELAGLADVVVIQEGGVQRLLDSQSHTIFAFSIAGIDDGHTTTTQDGIDVGKVEVHFPCDIHQFGYTTSGITQRIVGLGEGFGYGEVLVHLDEALVIDDEESIHTLAHLLDPFEGLEDLRRPLKEEGDRDDTDGQQTCLHSDLADDGGCTRTRTTTHTSGDEDHTRLSSGESNTDLLPTLFGCIFGALRLSSSTETLSDRRADHNLILYGAMVKCLLIGIT